MKKQTKEKMRNNIIAGAVLLILSTILVTSTRMPIAGETDYNTTLQNYLFNQHKENGTHGNVTVESLNVTIGNFLVLNGNVGIGNTNPGSELEVSASAGNTILEISTFSATATDSSMIKLQKSSSATINTLAVTAQNEDLGRINVFGVHTGSASVLSSQILFEQDAAANANQVPGRITFRTADTAGLKDSFVVDDSQNVLIANGNGLVVGALAMESAGGGTAEMQILGTTGGDDSSILLGRWTNGVGAGKIIFYKSRNPTIGSNTAITTGDNLGTINAYGDDGTDDDTLSSQIIFDTEGTIGTGRVPGVISFSTAKDTGDFAIEEAMRINSNQRIGINVTAPTSKLHIAGNLTIQQLEGQGKAGIWHNGSGICIGSC